MTTLSTCTYLLFQYPLEVLSWTFSCLSAPFRTLWRCVCGVTDPDHARPSRRVSGREALQTLNNTLLNTVISGGGGDGRDVVGGLNVAASLPNLPLATAETISSSPSQGGFLSGFQGNCF